MTDEKRDVHQALMDRAYAKWYGPDGKTTLPLSKEEWWDILDEPEKVAVANGNFNYQVCNGGFPQWDDNRYATDEAIELIVEMSESLKSYEGQKVIRLIEKFQVIRKEWKNNEDDYSLDGQGDEDEDWNIYFKAANELSDLFYGFNTEWLKQVDAKLAETYKM